MDKMTKTVKKTGKYSKYHYYFIKTPSTVLIYIKKIYKVV